MLDIISQESDYADNRPLPLIVAEKWGFELAYVEEDSVFWFSIQDWIIGILSISSNKARQVWYNKLNRKVRISIPLAKFPYIASNGKTYKMLFSTQDGLLNLLSSFRITKNKKQLLHLRNHLATLFPQLSYLAIDEQGLDESTFNEQYFQSKLIHLLKKMNVKIISEKKKLKSGKFVDIILENKSNEVMIVECKPNMKGHQFYTAIGKIILYCKEYERLTGIKPIPVIATTLNEKNELIKEDCDLLGIKLWEIGVV